MMKVLQAGETFMGRLPHGIDLLAELNRLCLEYHISLGRVEVLGAVSKARVGYYQQQTQEYRFLDFGYPLEITNLIGNVSLKDGQPFVHAHITLSDQDGHAFGGHLAPGTILYAGEVVIQSFAGATLQREKDQKTGLPLWIAR